MIERGRLSEHKAAARAVFDVWSTGETERLDGLIAPDVVHHDPYDPHGAEGLAGMKRTINLNRSAFSDMRLTVEDQVAEDEKGRHSVAWGNDSYRRASRGGSNGQTDHDHRHHDRPLRKREDRGGLAEHGHAGPAPRDWRSRTRVTPHAAFH
jgi:ketosteroid isomerase-like protein